MLRIAYCSPVNPVASGISDYSEELLPYLGQYADITLFIERDIVPTNPNLSQHLAIKRLDHLPRMHQQQPFDGIIYHMGNSPAHATIYELLLRIPGVVVLHDWVLHHFKLWYAAERKKDVGAYLHEMQERYGMQGQRVARQMSRGQLQDAAFQMPLVEDVVQHAHGLIGHSQLVVERARMLCPTLPAAVVPMGVPLTPPIDRDAARVALDLPLNSPIWASFGHINPYKRLESALRAFARFRAAQPGARYVLVGSVSPNYDLPALVRRLDLQDAVLITGHMPQDQFDLYVAASDLCLNLRSPTAGETSASLLRLLAAGRPTLVSARDAFSELPDDVCAKVDVDRSEATLILAYARLLQTYPSVAGQLGENARMYIARRHSLDAAAQGYMHFLCRLYGWGEVPKQRPVLWEIEPKEQALNVSPVNQGQEITKDQVVKGATAASVVSALDPVTVGIAHAAAELGMRPTSEQPLQDLATIVVDLFQTPEQ